MATKVSERVKKLRCNFMKWHNEGLSIYQIATLCNLTPQTVYQYLQEIADENGVTRDSLLQLVRSHTSERILRTEERKVRIDVQQLKNGFSDVKSSIQKICDKIDTLISKED